MPEALVGFFCGEDGNLGLLESSTCCCSGGGGGDEFMILLFPMCCVVCCGDVRYLLPRGRGSGSGRTHRMLSYVYLSNIVALNYLTHSPTAVNSNIYMYITDLIAPLLLTAERAQDENIPKIQTFAAIDADNRSNEIVIDISCICKLYLHALPIICILYRCGYKERERVE